MKTVVFVVVRLGSGTRAYSDVYARRSDAVAAVRRARAAGRTAHLAEVDLSRDLRGSR